MTQTDQRDQQEQNMEQQLQIREVTQIQASWTEQERGGPGAFSMQLILDNGVEEYIIRPTAEDADILLQLLQRSDHATFDLSRKVLMFSNLDVD